jgi:ribosome-associated protein
VTKPQKPATKKPAQKLLPTSHRGRKPAKATSSGKRPAKAAANKGYKKAAKARAVLDAPVASAHDEARREEALAGARVAIDAALDKKALMPVLLDVSGRASYTDFILVVSGRSDRQVEAIAEGVADAMKRRGSAVLGREGAGSGRWTLLDFGDVIVHVFYHPVREVYDIEGLWIDAPRVEIDVPPEARLYHPDALYTTV